MTVTLTRLAAGSRAGAARPAGGRPPATTARRRPLRGADSVALLDALAAAPRTAASAWWPRTSTTACAPDSAADAAFCRAPVPRARRPAPRRDGPTSARARPATAAGSRRRRAWSATRSCERCARGRRARRSSWPTPATTRRRRCSCGCCAARAAPGLGAMRPRAGDLLRPMLARLARSDVLDHLARARPALARGPDQRRPRFLRNRVRHELIPYLEAASTPPSARRWPARRPCWRKRRSCSRPSPPRSPCAPGRGDGASRAARWRRLRGRWRGSRPQRVRARGGGLRGVALDHVDGIIDLAARRGAVRPAGSASRRPRRRHPFRRDPHRPRRSRRPASDAALEVPAARRCRTDAGSSRASYGGRVAGGRPSRGPLTVRTRRPGDRVRSAGREMSLKRFLMDRRVPAADRDRLPVVACGRTYVWVFGQQVEGRRVGLPRPAGHTSLYPATC